MTELLGDGPVTKRHVEKALVDHFKTKAKLLKAEGQVISKGLGFVADVMRVQLTWDVKDGLPSKIIVKAPKIANVQDLMKQYGGGADNPQDSAAFVPAVHATECAVYNFFGSQAPVPIPKVYAAQPITDTEPGYIIMDDIADKGVLVDNIATGLNLNQWTSVVECLADVHAWSLTTNVPWREKVADMTQMKEMFKMFTQMAEHGLKTARQNYPEYFGDVPDSVLQHLTMEKMIEEMEAYTKVTPEVLVHGDCWMNNMMFEKKPDGTAGDKVYALFDWQISHRGSPITDLARLTHWCVNHELRRANEIKVLKVYYNRLTAKAGKAMTATFEQIEGLYRRILALNGLMGVFMIEMMLISIAKVNEENGAGRKKEMLERAKAGYEDAAKYYKF